MGEADLTYDFRDIDAFVEAFRQGAEFLMGSRFRGNIEDGAMPRLHRYFGTPVTTWMLNRIYHSKYSDIHCGIRGITMAALKKINLRSQSWEYASEMVIKAARLDLRIREIPVKFYKDREGRQSHLKRGGWLTPWFAGWLTIKNMLVSTPDTFLIKPGLALMFFGLLLSIVLSITKFSIGPITFDLYWMILVVSCATLGYGFLQTGVFARFVQGLRPNFTQRINRIEIYDKGMIVAAVMVLLGMCLVLPLAWRYIEYGLRLPEISRSAILGLLLIIVGFQTFCFTLLMEMGKRMMGNNGK
jgi:hypothetical protein